MSCMWLRDICKKIHKLCKVRQLQEKRRCPVMENAKNTGQASHESTWAGMRQDKSDARYVRFSLIGRGCGVRAAGTSCGHVQGTVITRPS